MNSISNETLGRLEAYKKISSDVVNKIENNMTYVETLLIYEIMNSNFFNKDKMFFNYQLFSRLTVKKYSKLYDKELTGLRKDLVESLNNDLKYVTDDLKDNIKNMILILDRPIEESFEEKCNVMIENFEESLEEIIESNAALISSSETQNLNYIGQDKKQKEAQNKIQKDIEEAKLEEEARFEEEARLEEKARLEEEARTKLEAEEKLKEKEAKIKAKQEEIRKREENIRLKKQQIEAENLALEQENKQIENMLGAIDNIYDEMNQADLNQIDYTTFLKYIEEDDVEDIDLDDIIKEEGKIEINENLSKTLDDLDLGSKKSFDDMSEMLEATNDIEEVMSTKEIDDELSKVLGDVPGLDSLDIESEISKQGSSKTLDQMLEIDTTDLDDLEINQDSLDDELSKTLEDMSDLDTTDLDTELDLDDELSKTLEDSSLDLEKELLDSIDLSEEIESTDELVGDIDDLDELLEGLELEEKEEEPKKGKLGRIKFGFRNK